MKPHEDWLYKSSNDLKAAKKLMEGGDPVPDAAIYHTHQCAEKSLKAYLAYREQPIQKTHNLIILLEMCMGLDNSFSILTQACVALNPYATFFRYPDGILIPDPDDIIEAIRYADEIESYIKNKFESESL
jgi:HEPN domain-containing protein